jgi:S-adenosylmethionine:tRNA ribosyltransferase-isomerase
LGALASREHLHKAYCEALQQGYLWHEFGDLNLIMKGGVERTYL